MSQPPRPRKPADPRPPLPSWADLFHQALAPSSAGLTMLLAGAPRDMDPTQLRQQWLASLSHSIDQVLRSPAFLESLKRNFDALDPAALEQLRQCAADQQQLLAGLRALQQRLNAQPLTPAQEDAIRCCEKLLQPPQFRKQEQPVRVGASPHEVVFQRRQMRLLHYRAQRPLATHDPVLICYALVNRPYILDLLPQRSVIGRLLEGGLDVYLIDWGQPSDADHVLTLHNYIGERLLHAVRVVAQRSGRTRCNLLGYCMGGTMAAIFTAVFPALVKNLILMAAPIDFSDDSSLLQLWSRPAYFDADRLIDAFGNCPAAFLQATFALMKPVQNLIEKHVGFVENRDNPQFLETFFAMEQWTNDNIPVAGETFREFVKCFYQQNQLVRGAYHLGQQPVYLQRIACPLLLLAADFDHLAPPATTFGIIPHVQSTDIRKMSLATGHVGLAVSSKAHQQYWPNVAQWIAAHSS